MNAPTTTGPKFSVGQKVFAVRKERMQYNFASPIAIGTITSISAPVGLGPQARYTITNIDPVLTFFEHELHATAGEAKQAVDDIIDDEYAILRSIRERAIAHIEANA